MGTKKTTSSKKALKALTLSSPWVSYHNMVAAFFKGDSEIVVGDVNKAKDGVYKFVIKSDNKDKIAALNKILIKDITMGNVTLQIRPQSRRVSDGKVTLKDFEVAFTGNKYYKNIQTIAKGLFPEMSYIMMSAEPVQFYNDQLDDYYGNKTMVVRDIMDIICVKLDNVYFSTELIEK